MPARRSFFDGHLILEYPTRIHELVPRIFTRLADQGTRLPPGLVNGASSDIPLLIGTKSPDFSLYDDSTNHPFDGNTVAEVYPTIVFEVAYSQNLRKVSEAAARVIGGSFGAVKLVVVIKLQYNTPDDSFDGIRPHIDTATADIWAMTDLEELDDYIGEANCLIPIPVDTQSLQGVLLHPAE